MSPFPEKSAFQPTYSTSMPPLFSVQDTSLQAPENLSETTQNVPLRSPEDIDLETLNRIPAEFHFAKFFGAKIKPVQDMSRLFNKQIILDDETTLEIETLKVPGFIGIADAVQVPDPQGNMVSGYEDIVQFLDRDGLLICVYQWCRERYGTPLDVRQPLEQNLFIESFIKNESYHVAAIVPAQYLEQNEQLIKSFAILDNSEIPSNGTFSLYTANLNRRIAVAQRLVFPKHVSRKQARGYISSIINWLGVLNCFIKFSKGDINAGDPTPVVDRVTLKEFLKNSALASLGNTDAINFLNQTENRCLCGDYIYIGLNSLLYPFNKQGLTLLLDGDQEQAEKILELRDKHSIKQQTILSERSNNPKFKNFNILMPLVSEDLPPLDVLMVRNEQAIDPQSIPFPPFKISQIVRLALQTLFPRHKFSNRKLADIQARMFSFMELFVLRYLGLESFPDDDSKVLKARQIMAFVKQQIEQQDDSDKIDDILQKVLDRLLGSKDNLLVPARVYVDCTQNDESNNLPKGWGFKLETIGALVYRGVIKAGRTHLNIDE